MSERQVYHGIEIIVYEKSISVGGRVLFLERKPTEVDIRTIKGFIEAGRLSLASEVRASQRHLNHLLGGNL